MSSLLGILNLGRRALVAQQTGLNAVGNNIANVNTPGYTRQEVILESDSVRIPGIGGIGTGVSIAAVRRSRDIFADFEVRNEQSVLGWWRSQHEVLSRVETVMNDVDSSGLSDTLSAFWSGWQALSDQPEDRLARETVAERGRELVTTLNAMAGELARMRRSVDTAIQDKASKLTDLGERVANLNARVIAQNGEAPGLADARDALIDEMSALANISVTPEDSGAVIVRLGSMILAGRTETLGLAMNGAAEPGTTGRGPVWDHNGETVDIRGGELGGLLRIRDEALPELERRLDRLAYGIATEVNRLHREGTDLDGIGGGDFFVLPGSADELDPSGSAARIRLADAIARDPARIAAGTDGTPGDNRTALAILELRTSRIDALGGSSPDEFWSAAAGFLGNRVNEAATRVDEHGLAVDQFENLRQSLSGVSLDEEAAKLVVYEQAYAAAARVISVADELARIIIEATT